MTLLHNACSLIALSVVSQCSGFHKVHLKAGIDTLNINVNVRLYTILFVCLLWMSFILGSRWWCWRYHLFSFPPHVPAPPGAIQGECDKGFVFVSGIDKLRGLLAAQFFGSHSGKDILTTKSTVFQCVTHYVSRQKSLKLYC